MFNLKFFLPQMCYCMMCQVDCSQCIKKHSPCV
jgi:hypothetical protein